MRVPGVLGPRLPLKQACNGLPRSRVSLRTRCESRSYEAVIVLGGGLDGAGRPQPWARQRLDKALEVQAGRCPIVISGGGTPHKPPPLDKDGFPVAESTAYAAYLLDKGVPAGSLLKETASYDTVGNAYFTLLTHVFPRQWRHCALVTSAFHMPRSQAIFSFCLDLLGEVSPMRPEMDFIASDDTADLTEEALVARRHKEREALETWQRDSRQLASLADLHEWLHRTHLCYAVARQGDWAQDAALAPDVKASY